MTLIAASCWRLVVSPRAAILPAPARLPHTPTPRPRILTLNTFHTGESIKAESFSMEVVYIQDDQQSWGKTIFSVTIARIKSDQSIPACLTNPYRLQGLLGRKPVQLISGYRSLLIPHELRARSSGVAKKSYHKRAGDGFSY
ncbi:DUF882 domain-containing protein [Salmonella enterica subsp. enterica]|nr:DUF882 domain-containing protein [Salmonella enterica subsp. enterica]